MREGWKEVRLTDFIWFQRGFDLPKKSFKEGKIPVYGSTSILGYHDESKVKAPGIITGRSGTLGSFQYATEDFWPHNTTLWVKDFKGNNRKFAYYLLQTLDFTIFNTGGAVPTLNRNLLNAYIINVPPLPTQQKIAEILSAYDDLIENNLRRIEVLEEMAQQTYEEWFVRMRYPGYVNDTINPETGLPKGWENKEAQKCYKITIGKTPPRKEQKWFNPEDRNEQIKWASITDIRNSQIFVYDTKETITKDAAERFNFNFVEKGNVVLSFKLTVGLVAIATEDMTTNEAIAHFNKPLNIPTSYTYYFLKNFDYNSLGSTSSIGKAINSKIVKKIPIKMPVQNVIDKFEDIAGPILIEIDNLNKQNHRLRESRDLLLPRLMMGLADAEEILG